MIAGLPLSAWVLLIASAGIGLAVELGFYTRYRRRGSRPWRGEDESQTGAQRPAPSDL